MKISVVVALVALGFSAPAWADVAYPPCAAGLDAGSYCTNSGSDAGCGSCALVASCPAPCAPNNCNPTCIDDAGGSHDILECEPGPCESSSGGSSSSSKSGGTSSGGGSSSNPNSSGGCSSGFGTTFGPWALVALSGLVWSRRRRNTRG